MYAGHCILLIVIYCNITDLSATVGDWNLAIILLTYSTIISAADRSNFFVNIGIPSFELKPSGM
jgi:hypothetical protein